MARWELYTLSERPDGRLTGRFTDPDRRARLSHLANALTHAEAERARAQRAFDAELADAKNQDQHGLVDEAIRHLADRRAR